MMYGNGVAKQAQYGWSSLLIDITYLGQLYANLQPLNICYIVNKISTDHNAQVME